MVFSLDSPWFGWIPQSLHAINTTQDSGVSHAELHYCLARMATEEAVACHEVLYGREAASQSLISHTLLQLSQTNKELGLKACLDEGDVRSTLELG